MKELEPNELGRYNGKNGNPAYIVHRGSVYDVTQSAKWNGGLHMLRHHAGEDLTAEIGAAPHGVEVLARYPQVGVLKKQEAPDRPLPLMLSRLLTRFPMLRRHPHPMTVHFPIVFVFAAALFTVLYLCTGIASFESTALNCLGAGLVFTPVAMMTGYYAWWLNYSARPLKPVIIKQILSWLLLVIEITVFLWRLAVPDILNTFRSVSVVYLMLTLSFVPLVSVIGWFGASLTFPIEKE
jgi:predicted heme/steroid binding protein/uncharacterized membrane protein